MYTGRAISWLSQCQNTVAMSTTKAEMIAVLETGKEVIWMKMLFEQMLGKKLMPMLFVDNSAAVKLSYNPE